MNKTKFTLKTKIIVLVLLLFQLNQNQVVFAKQANIDAEIEDSIIMATDIVTIHRLHKGKKQHRRWNNHTKKWLDSNWIDD